MRSAVIAMPGIPKGRSLLAKLADLTNAGLPVDFEI
jgi:hypothetical protein